MTTALIVSNLLLWLLVILLLVIVYALTRQIGLLHERVAPVGAMMPTDGPKIGEQIEPVVVSNLNGQKFTIGGTADNRVLIYFISPSCPICRSLLPVAKQLAQDETDLKLLYASDGGDAEEHGRYADEHELNSADYVLSRDLGISLGVSKLPFAVLLSKDGVLKGRGLVNSREHLESLLTADDIDVPTLQAYLAETNTQGGTNPEPGDKST